MKHLIGITAYGGLPFLELCLRSIQETLTVPNVDVLVIVAKPGDSEMQEFLRVRDIKFLAHTENKGFPASLNDLLDYAFVDGAYDTLMIMGNDTVAMPGAIDTMIQQAETTDWDIYCGSEFDCRFLYDTYPEARQYFKGPTMVFTDFSARPWDLHRDFRDNTIEPNTLKDVRNFTLYKRRVFDVVGYADPNFWPNGYFEDNDYARRCALLGMRAAGLPSAAFFHFWSRTIHQGEQRANDRYFLRNKSHYRAKHGSDTWGQETFHLPFNGQPYSLNGIDLPQSWELPDRDLEARLIDYWRGL